MPGFVGVGYGEYVPIPDAPAASSVVWLGSDNTLHKRVTGVWSEVTTPAGSYRLAAPPGNPDVLLISNGEDLWITTDGGGTFTLVNVPDPDLSVEDVACTDANTFYLTNWSSGSPSDANRGVIWKTTNGGTTWTNIVPPMLDEDGQYGTERPRLVVTRTYIYFTTWLANGVVDQNYTFHRCNLDGTGVVSLSAISDSNGEHVGLFGVQGDDDTIYAAEYSDAGVGGFGVQRVDGATCTAVTPSGFAPSGTNLLYRAIKGHVGGRVIAMRAEDTGLAFQNRLLRSENFGASWTQLLLDTGTLVFSSNGMSGLEVNPSDPDEWWCMAAADDAVLHSTDGGVTWSTEAVVGLTHYYVTKLLAVSS